MENKTRKMVTIRKVNAINSMEGYDNIVLATVDGWKVIIKKDELKLNEHCLFFEIDSFIPEEDSRFSFLGKTVLPSNLSEVVNGINPLEVIF